MNRRIDAAQVVAMARTNCPVRVIADRLDCSERQVRRILQAHDVLPMENPLIDTDDEPLLWTFYRTTGGESYREIGYRFGLSYETIRAYFTQPRQIGEPV